MDYIFDVFYEEVFKNLERSGLRTRSSRQNVIDRLNVMISGCSAGEIFFTIDNNYRELKNSPQNQVKMFHTKKQVD
jgi:hypothetical protein